MARWISTYGNTYFGVGCIVAAGAALICFALALCIACIAARRRRSAITVGSMMMSAQRESAAAHGSGKRDSAGDAQADDAAEQEQSPLAKSPSAKTVGSEITGCGCIAMGCVAALLMMGQFFVGLAASVAAGVMFAPAGAMFAVSAVPWLFVVPLAVAAASPKIWRGHPGSLCGVCAFVCTAAGRAMAIKPAMCWSLTVVAMTVTAVTFLGMQGMCYCSNPTEASSWASRRVEPPLCAAGGGICHAYPILGQTPDEMLLVAQWVVDVADDADDASVVTASLCETSGATQHVSSHTCAATAAATQHNALRKISYSYLAEDRRRIAHFHFTGLKPLTGYRARLQLTGNGAGASSSTKDVFFRTVPSLSDTTTPISFVGGGDYYMGDKGLASLAASLQATAPDAMFMFIGGDMSYANNMRTCYRRWDQFFVEVTSRTNALGWALPFLMIPGNHEAGGYISATGDPLDERYHFYYQFFPAVDTAATAALAAAAASGGGSGSLSTTALADLYPAFHAHRLGARFGVIGLDSGCFRRLRGAQQNYFEALLKNWTATSGNASSSQQQQQGVFTVPMFHVPGYSGRDEMDSKSDLEVRGDIRDVYVPLMDQYRVATAFQFHEHLFSRSKPLNGKGEVQAARKDGVVFLGDGALGVYKTDRIARTSGEGHTEIALPINFAYAATFYPGNRTFHVRSVQPISADTLRSDAILKGNTQLLYKVIDDIQITQRS